MSDDLGAELDAFKAPDVAADTDILAEILFLIQAVSTTGMWMSWTGMYSSWFFTFNSFIVVPWLVFLVYGFVSFGELVTWFFVPDQAVKWMTEYAYWGSIIGYGALAVVTMLMGLLMTGGYGSAYWGTQLWYWIMCGGLHVVFKDRFVARWEYLSANNLHFVKSASRLLMAEHEEF